VQKVKLLPLYQTNTDYHANPNVALINLFIVSYHSAHQKKQNKELSQKS